MLWIINNGQLNKAKYKKIVSRVANREQRNKRQKDEDDN